MTLVLAIDCAAAACSAALCRIGDGAEGAQPLASAILPMERGHAEVLMPLLARLREEAGIAWADIGLIAATVGPGSFTGVRIGLSAARGIALATGAPTVAVQSLEVIAAEMRGRSTPTAPLLVALDSRRGDAYGQWFLPGSAHPADIIEIDRMEAPEAVGRAEAILVGGDLAERLAVRLRECGRHARAIENTEIPDPVHVATLAFQRYGLEGPSALSPVYLRPADAKPAQAKPAKQDGR